MKIMTLGEVCARGSSNIAQKDLDGNTGCYPIYGASGFIKNVDFYHQDKEYIAVVKDGAGIGRAMLLPAKSSVIGTMQYLIPNSDSGISTKYLYYAITAMDLAKYFSGATIPHIYFKDYQKELIRVPDRMEQDRIARIFEKIDATIALRNEQLVRLDELVRSRFIEMFGDPVTNSMNLPICELSEHIQFLTSGSRGWAKYFTDEGEYFITIKNVKNCRITLDDVQHIVPPDNAEAKRTKVQEGDLLISITADLGRTGVVTKEIAEHGGYINQHLTCIRLNQGALRPLYVTYYMESDAGKRQFQSKNQSAVKAGLNFNSINTLRLMVPPMELQDAFISFVQATDKSKAAIQHSLDELEILKKSLMQQYFG